MSISVAANSLHTAKLARVLEQAGDTEKKKNVDLSCDEKGGYSPTLADSGQFCKINETAIFLAM